MEKKLEVDLNIYSFEFILKNHVIYVSVCIPFNLLLGNHSVNPFPRQRIYVTIEKFLKACVFESVSAPPYRC
jgi:hypothetical protein